MPAFIEGTEELATSPQNTPFTKCVHVVIVRVVNSILFEVGNTLLIIEAVLAIWRAYHPEVIEVGALYDNRIGWVLLDEARAGIEYILRLVHHESLDLRQGFRHLLTSDYCLHGYLMQFLLIEIVFLNPVHLADGIEGHYNLLPALAAQTLSYLFEVLNVKLRELFKLHPLIVGNTLYLFRVVKTAKIYLCPIVYAPDAVLCEAEHLVYAKRLGRYLVVLVNSLQYGCSHLTHYKCILPVVERLYEYRLGNAIALGGR